MLFPAKRQLLRKGLFISYCTNSTALCIIVVSEDSFHAILYIFFVFCNLLFINCYGPNLLPSSRPEQVLT